MLAVAAGCVDNTGAGAIFISSTLGADGIGVADDAESPIIAMDFPTATTSPSLYNCFTNIPAVVEGTSESTLSVAISRIGSSCSTLSPSFFNHLVIVASATLSPILGIFNSTCDIVFYVQNFIAQSYSFN